MKSIVPALPLLVFLNACIVGGGGFGQSDGANSGTDSGVSLARDGSTGCGASGQTCCNGTACNTGLMCQGSTCQALCGSVGETCCNGTACNAGLVCESAECVQPAPMDAGLDAGNTPDAGQQVDGGNSPDGGADAGVFDAGMADAATADAGEPSDGGSSPGDGGTDAGGAPDAGIPDAGMHDAGTSGDAGMQNPVTCTATTGASYTEVRCPSGNVCDLNDVCETPQYAHSNGAVTDAVTGLVWQQDMASNPCPNDQVGYCTWGDAQTYCNALNLGGFSSGWRLPSAAELFSLIDMGTMPTISHADFPNTPSAYLWTSTPYSGGGYFMVSFDDGSCGGNSGIFSGYSVRCVR